MNRAWLSLILGSLVAAGCLLWSVKLVRDFQEVRTCSSWPTVIGVVTGREVEQADPQEPKYVPRVRYTYRVGGEELSGEGPWLEERRFTSRTKAEAELSPFTVGEDVEVYHDPAEPSRATLVPGALSQVLKNLAIAWGLAIFWGAVAVAGFFTLRQRRREGVPTPVAESSTDNELAEAYRQLPADELESRVRNLEELAARRPGAYRLRVLSFALLGYAYVYGLVVLLIAAAVALVWGAAVGHLPDNIDKLVLLPLGLLVLVLRGLWVKLASTEGLELSRQEAPELFELIEDLRRQTRAPRVHRVFLIPQPHAFVRQVPRLGVFGWFRNHLVLGLPYLQALSREQLASGVAHELTHLSGGDSKFGGRIQRVRESWDRILERVLEKEHRFMFLLLPFLRWYVPRLDAFTRVARRQNEYGADRVAARVAGSNVVAETMIQHRLRGAWLSAWYWPSVNARADDLPDLGRVTPYTDLTAAMGEEADREWSERSLDRALRENTVPADPLPSLRDRLTALEEEPRLPEPPEVSAAEELLGDALGDICAHFDEEWRREVEPSWKERHEWISSRERQLAELNERAEAEGLDEDEAYERARLCETMVGIEAALPLYTEVAEQYPDHVAAKFSRGRILLELRDEAGLPLVE